MHSSKPWFVQEGFDFSTGGRDDRVELEARRAAEVEKRIRNDTAGKSKETTIENIRRNIERRMMEYGLAPVRRGVSSEIPFSRVIEVDLAAHSKYIGYTNAY